MPQFSQQGPKLVGTPASGVAQQGAAVVLSADGNTAIVGGPGDNNGQGAAWVYTRSGGVWTQGPKLVGPGASSQFGSSASLSADGTAIVGGPGENNGLGAAWVMSSGNVWTSQGQLSAPDASGAAQQGSAVSISSGGITTIAMVGAPANNSGQGAAWVYRRTPGLSWMEGPELIDTGAIGAIQQGRSVSLSADGNTVLVGGPGDSGGQGAAWVYRRGPGGGGGGGGGSWTPLGKLSATDASGAAQQGSSVSLSSDGNTVIVGGPGDNNGQGAAWVYTRSGGVWTQQGTKLSGADVSGAAQQGSSVSLSADGNTAIVGGAW